MLYKGYEIEKYSNGEGKYVPNHVIREYYQSEKARIDRLIKLEKSSVTMTESVEESIDNFLEEMGY
jgi:hypothetical protein